MSTVDVIQIDTEGYDHVVLGLVDLARYRPQVVVFEHIQLDAATCGSAGARLRAHGYETFSDEMDTVAVHGDALARHERLARAVRSAQRHSMSTARAAQ